MWDENIIMKLITMRKSLSMNFKSKFLYVNDDLKINSRSGLMVTLFGSTGKLGLIVSERLGKIGSDMVLPQRFSSQYREDVEFLYLTGNTGQMYIYKKTNFNNPHQLRKLIQNSNVVVNMIGPNYNCRKLEQFEEANIHVPRRLAKLARQQGIKWMVHFSALGVSKDSESWDLRTKFEGE